MFPACFSCFPCLFITLQIVVVVPRKLPQFCSYFHHWWIPQESIWEFRCEKLNSRQILRRDTEFPTWLELLWPLSMDLRVRESSLFIKFSTQTLLVIQMPIFTINLKQLRLGLLKFVTFVELSVWKAYKVIREKAEKHTLFLAKQDVLKWKCCGRSLIFMMNKYGNCHTFDRTSFHFVFTIRFLSPKSDSISWDTW